MSTANVRRIARIWSILVLIAGLLVIFTNRPGIKPVAAADWFLLSLWGVAALGLLLAWRWELVGGIITIAAMFIRELAWVILKGGWSAYILVVWLFVVAPAILFLVAWRLETKPKKP
jgi:hypothetical protein